MNGGPQPLGNWLGDFALEQAVRLDSRVQGQGGRRSPASLEWIELVERAVRVLDAGPVLEPGESPLAHFRLAPVRIGRELVSIDERQAKGSDLGHSIREVAHFLEPVGAMEGAVGRGEEVAVLKREEAGNLAERLREIQRSKVAGSRLQGRGAGTDHG